jgi:hypothetical protein
MKLKAVTTVMTLVVAAGLLFSAGGPSRSAAAAGASLGAGVGTVPQGTQVDGA